jgi:hypothetical protein
MNNSSAIAETTQPSTKRTMDHYKCSTEVLTMSFFGRFGGEVNDGTTKCPIRIHVLDQEIAKKLISFLSTCTFVFCVN